MTTDTSWYFQDLLVGSVNNNDVIRLHGRLHVVAGRYTVSQCIHYVCTDNIDKTLYQITLNNK